MKKLIISRFLAMLVFAIVMIAEIFVTVTCGIDTNDSSNQKFLEDLCFSSGIFAVCLVYFFAGKKFYEVSIKKLILVFFIWGTLVTVASIFIDYLTILSGGLSCLQDYVLKVGITKKPFISQIIGFLVEMAVIVSGIIVGRIENNKTDGKHFVYISKVLAVIIGFITFSILKSIIGLIYDIPKMNYLDQIGLKWGFLTAMLVAGLWYFYIGFKVFRTNLKIALPVFLVCDLVVIFIWLASGILENALLGEVGYGGFLSGLKGILFGKVFWSASSIIFLSEALFLTIGVLLGRRFDKKRALPLDFPEITAGEPTE